MVCESGCPWFVRLFVSVSEVVCPWSVKLLVCPWSVKLLVCPWSVKLLVCPWFLGLAVVCEAGSLEPTLFCDGFGISRFPAIESRLNFAIHVN